MLLMLGWQRFFSDIESTLTAPMEPPSESPLVDPLLPVEPPKFEVLVLKPRERTRGAATLAPVSTTWQTLEARRWDCSPFLRVVPPLTLKDAATLKPALTFDMLGGLSVLTSIEGGSGSLDGELRP